jgi:two-component system NtrC family sensor kinase
MKIENNIILSNVFNITLILLVGFFAMENLNVMLTKLRFVEIADDLNASFLEMRISEKNYFLYGDEAALFEIRDKINNTMESIEAVKNDISRAIGEDNLEKLRDLLKRYSTAVEEIGRSRSRDIEMETMLRAAGRKLREFSDTTTKLEKRRVNEIISNSKKVLFYSFWAIVVMAIVVSHFISQKILLSLREIEKLAKSISNGNFNSVKGVVPADEFGTVMNAINTMSHELKTREEELIQSKKLASLGVLTAGVAHELTNPLNNISMIAQNFMEYHDFLNKESRIELMKKVEGEAERIQEIVKNLLDFSKPKEANRREADLNDTVQKSLKLMQNTLDISNIETELSLEPGLPSVFIDDHQIQQVMVNLILNAVHAMQPGGTLYLATERGESSDTVRIDVRDTGKGIPPEFLPHIFDPFFTTKGVGGTGLGLSVSYGIIKNHKGNIKVESTVGSGTTFTIELPVYRGKEALDEQL